MSISTAGPAGGGTVPSARASARIRSTAKRPCPGVQPGGRSRPVAVGDQRCPCGGPWSPPVTQWVPGGGGATGSPGGGPRGPGGAHGGRGGGGGGGGVERQPPGGRGGGGGGGWRA